MWKKISVDRCGWEGLDWRVSDMVIFMLDLKHERKRTMQERIEIK
jgi:hypothetical protein